ncbi:YdcF family protein, partial [Micromonospora sp. NPDC002296]|uniref:YdcF family protein n=1 Tax=Micromonospora sp. NPDC002296 TaxID=3154271 RepID=UPI00331F27F8
PGRPVASSAGAGRVVTLAGKPPRGGHTSPTATVLVVFGRGVLRAGDTWALTPASIARVRAAVDYVAANEASFARAAGQGRAPRIVFSGGWAEAAEGARPPPQGWREGDLMLRQALAAGLDRHAELRAETRSRSTLENLLHTVEDGLLDGHAFGPGQPLGIVSHTWHLPRIRYLARRTLGLRGPALLDVHASGGEALPRWWREPAARIASRLWFLGARDPAGLLRRERRLVTSMRRVDRLARRRRDAAGGDCAVVPPHPGPGASDGA